MGQALVQSKWALPPYRLKEQQAALEEQRDPIVRQDISRI
jgi:hypothetical protein